jgi:FtsH-binding integral membrane protein
MKIEKSNLGNTLGTIGVLSGLAYSIKNKKSFGMSALYVIAFGIGGLILGNSVTKFYE